VVTRKTTLSFPPFEPYYTSSFEQTASAPAAALSQSEQHQQEEIVGGDEETILLNQRMTQAATFHHQIDLAPEPESNKRRKMLHDNMEGHPFSSLKPAAVELRGGTLLPCRLPVQCNGCTFYLSGACSR
jgi:hypothetical protein